MLVSNKIFQFEDSPENPGRVKVTIQSTVGMTNTSIIEILHSQLYTGTYQIEALTTGSFELKNMDNSYPAFIGDEQGCAWQVSRSRPVLVNPEGESVDTLRQAVNQVSNDVGNKNDLNDTISDKRDVVKAINSLNDFVQTNERLRNLINSIACN